VKAVIFIGIVWLFGSISTDLNKQFLPDFLGVIGECWKEAKELSLFKNCLVTLGRVFAGVVLGLLVGVPLGILVGVSPKMHKELMPSVEFFRAIPTSMLFPVFILLSGIGELSKMLIVVYATFPIIVVALAASGQGKAEAIARSDYLAIHRSRLGIRFLISAFLWDSIPAVIAGVKVSLSIGLVLVIVTEMFFSASSGVGWAARKAYLVYDIDRMYAYVIIVGVLGLLLNRLLDSFLARARAIVGHK
jgi:NitT/TauT family transport system permease protein